MPIIQNNDTASLIRNEVFYAPPHVTRPYRESFLTHCRYLGKKKIN